MSSHFDLLLDWYKLRPLWDVFCLHNPSGRLPYHNNVHAKFVALDTLAYLGPNITDQDAVRRILAAAILHDVGHTGQPDDKANIDIALGWVESLVKISGCQLSSPNIKKAIECTLFAGGKFPVTPQDVYQQALRDADLSTVFHIFEEEGPSQMRGLYSEMRSYTQLTWDSFHEKNTVFLRNAYFFTPVAQQRRDKCLEKCLLKASHGRV